MKKVVGIRDAKAHFSEYVELARSGADVIVTDRGRPVVRLVAMANVLTKTEDDVLDELEGAGLLDRGKRGSHRVSRPVAPVRRVSLTTLVREQRR